MVQIFDKENDVFLGEITEADLKLLQDNLEEESEADTDYYLNQGTADMLKSKGASQTLQALLDKALMGKDGVEIRWVH